MNNDATTPATILVIFGAGGDLTHRKLMPALYNLFLDGWMPENFAILGVGRKNISEDEFRQDLRDAISRFSRSGKVDEKQWFAFAPQIFFHTAELKDASGYAQIKSWIAGVEKRWGLPGQHLFYLAVPPALIEVISTQLKESDLLDDRQRTRMVIEKPFAHDLASAQQLNRRLRGMVAESQIYRIDHFLGKETVQNILAFRFANSMFEPVWNRRYIDHVQITIAEEMGIGHRGPYYEHAGALRDMIQNHLLQVLCHIAMEPPVTYVADELRNKKLDVLTAIRAIQPHEVSQYAVRGQYAAGTVRDQQVVGYRDEKSVATDSSTETYVALQLFVDNWRWQGVPFYLRTGKRLAAGVSEACIQFRAVPHRAFPVSAGCSLEPNQLTIRILPDEGIVLQFEAKYPGHRLLLEPAFMRFSYQDSFKATSREAYETLLLDVMLGDQALFMRADEVEAAWGVVMPILEHWAEAASGFPNYAAGSWGPQAADELLAKDGRRWLCTRLPQPCRASRESEP